MDTMKIVVKTAPRFGDVVLIGFVAFIMGYAGAKAYSKANDKTDKIDKVKDAIKEALK